MVIKFIEQPRPRRSLTTCFPDDFSSGLIPTHAHACVQTRIRQPGNSSRLPRLLFHPLATTDRNGRIRHACTKRPLAHAHATLGYALFMSSQTFVFELIAVQQSLRERHSGIRSESARYSLHSPSYRFSPLSFFLSEFRHGIRVAIMELNNSSFQMRVVKICTGDIYHPYFREACQYHVPVILNDLRIPQTEDVKYLGLHLDRRIGESAYSSSENNLKI